MLVNPAAHVDSVESPRRHHPAHNRWIRQYVVADPQDSQAGGDYFRREFNIKNRAWGGVHFSALNALKTVHF